VLHDAFVRRKVIKRVTTSVVTEIWTLEWPAPLADADPDRPLPDAQPQLQERAVQTVVIEGDVVEGNTAPVKSGKPVKRRKKRRASGRKDKPA
jgi:hypothetical protein